MFYKLEVQSQVIFSSQCFTVNLFIHTDDFINHTCKKKEWIKSLQFAFPHKIFIDFVIQLNLKIWFAGSTVSLFLPCMQCYINYRYHTHMRTHVSTLANNEKDTSLHAIYSKMTVPPKQYTDEKNGDFLKCTIDRIFSDIYKLENQCLYGRY